MLPNSDKAVLKFEKICYIYKKLVSYLYETVTCITTKGKETKMPGIFVDIKLRKNNSVPRRYECSSRGKITFKGPRQVHEHSFKVKHQSVTGLILLLCRPGLMNYGEFRISQLLVKKGRSLTDYRPWGSRYGVCIYRVAS